MQRMQARGEGNMFNIVLDSLEYENEYLYSAYVSNGRNGICSELGHFRTGSQEILPQESDYIDEYGINHGPGVEIGGVVWAPVNCGYHETDFKYGKLYQGSVSRKLWVVF